MTPDHWAATLVVVGGLLQLGALVMGGVELRARANVARDHADALKKRYPRALFSSRRTLSAVTILDEPPLDVRVRRLEARMDQVGETIKASEQRLRRQLSEEQGGALRYLTPEVQAATQAIREILTVDWRIVVPIGMLALGVALQTGAALVTLDL